MKIFNIMIAGIGGQGVITLATLFKLAGIKEGYSITGSERRGGAQREGSVSAIVRYIKSDGVSESERAEIVSPLLPSGSLNLLIGMEPIEALRLSNYLNNESYVIINTSPWIPIPVRMGKMKYPSIEEIIKDFRLFTQNIYSYDFNSLSYKNFGNIRLINLMCAGFASGLGIIPIKKDTFLQSIREQFSDIMENQEVFIKGFELALKSAHPV